MTLLASERVLSRIDTGNGELMLTSRRVAHRRQNKLTSILLEDVRSVVVTALTDRWVLVVSGTCVAMAACLVGIAIRLSVLGPVDIYHRLASALLFVTAFLVVTFGVKRFSTVQICSPRATIEFRIRSVIRKDINHFLLDLDKARIGRYFANQAHGGFEGEASVTQRPTAPPLPKWRNSRKWVADFLHSHRWLDLVELVPHTLHRVRQMCRPALVQLRSAAARPFMGVSLRRLQNPLQQGWEWVAVRLPVALIVSFIVWDVVRLLRALWD